MKIAFVTLISLFAAASVSAEDGWIPLFNGKDLSGWKDNIATEEKPEEKANSFVVEDGAIKVQGGRAHLFYVGEDGKASFKNFEFKAKVKLGSTEAGSNSGIYIHTQMEDKGWPSKGYECQVNSTKHKDVKKTGGLYGVKDVLNTSPAADDEWFDYEIKVEGKRIVIKINGEVTTDFTEPDDWDPSKALKNMDGRKLTAGTIALQGHDPISRVYYKDLYLKPLP
ncbi:DUF1080 domain-containing protein [Phragmitibacter flavus]|uniref:DUF1080 domain-containing protein n=1 Tax=Phragmitibacter flavus TaxID=2576071 RepID=A0A5R8KFF0_9BACT|nr:DUF1080 domain-containing protein [Phragmitibacter flavus]TLD71006.1 DUF1080 domain-containing protein [Phragmitibacter flavus]